MERIGAAFYGRKAAYDAALADPNGDALVEAIVRNVYPPNEPSIHAQRLADYMRKAAAALEAQEGAAIGWGELKFPEA